MAPERRLQPVVLRREPYGGLLFDPHDGTQVELDQTGFDFVAEWLLSRREPAAEDERRLVQHVQRELPSLGPERRELRVFERDPSRVGTFRNATVLAAPTLVDIQVTRRCLMGCPHCYASSDPDGADLPREALLGLIDELAACGVCQLALGGGEPLLHPALGETLYRARDRGLVPNLTTTGDGLTPELLDAMADCCGAVALSLEGVYAAYDTRRRAGFAFFRSVHDALREHGISTVFQVTLSAENLPALPSITDYCLSCPDLYGVIFLAYKSVGRGQGYQTPLSAVPPDELYPKLREAFLRLSGRTRVGYDCCLTPGIVGIDAELGHTDPQLLEGCSAVRTSVGVTTELDVVPCTFLTHRPLGNLRRQSFMQIWESEAARAFRQLLDGRVDEDAACRECSSRSGCLGGCPEWDLVRCLKRPHPPRSEEQRR